VPGSGEFADSVEGVSAEEGDIGKAVVSARSCSESAGIATSGELVVPAGATAGGTILPTALLFVLFLFVRSGRAKLGLLKSQTKPVKTPRTPPSLFSPMVADPAVGYTASTCERYSPSQTVTHF
jgi:hypothetical protein